ncbi:hypothetical protein EJ571_20055 [Mycobacteroides franklinii]|uniref:Uncharacterized protein n=1 Tax=Mycobacteroides franklinii TaxID=948102 RepID=A0A4R5P643_9MYCO|nr:hypothetical protein [Mycobacteroides franklinii]TDH18892.1 hypothetical protein EJ571_20055 [Mycobacteroides franklinii]
MPDDFVPPPPDVPVDPDADWRQPFDPPLTPNLEDLGYYDSSWGQLYGYDPGNWYNFDLGGFNIYGFDFLGYDRWGYDHWGYNWSGRNWAGYDRDGWDRDGRNEWGQRRGWPGDPRNQDWYNDHHRYEQYYQWKFQNDDPVYQRTQWNQAHGVNPDQYRDWNMNRDWHNPRNRDWAPSATTVINDVNARVSAPVVNPKTSLAQFISNDKAASSSGATDEGPCEQVHSELHQGTDRPDHHSYQGANLDAGAAIGCAYEPPKWLCTTGFGGSSTC